MTWQTSMGTADLRANFGGGRKHDLNVSTYSMYILLLFNDHDSLTLDEVGVFVWCGSSIINE